MTIAKRLSQDTFGLSGADPAYQGRGYGSSCLRVGIEVADQKSASLAMISSNPRNIPFYGRHGFTALSTKISAGVVITGMIRPKVQDKIAVLLTTTDPREGEGEAPLLTKLQNKITVLPSYKENGGGGDGGGGGGGEETDDVAAAMVASAVDSAAAASSLNLTAEGDKSEKKKK